MVVMKLNKSRLTLWSLLGVTLLELAVSWMPVSKKNDYCFRLHASDLSDTSSSTTTTTTTTTTASTLTTKEEKPSFYQEHSSSIFGTVRRIRMPGEDEEDASFLGSMGVPTYATIDEFVGDDNNVVSLSSSSETLQKNRKARGLEGILNQGPAFIVDDVISRETCEKMIQDCEMVGFGNYKSGRNHHGAMQILVSQAMADAVAQQLSHHIDISQVESLRNEMMLGTTGRVDTEDHDVRLVFGGLNRRWRIYKYDPSGDEFFAPHIDAGFPPSGLSEDGTMLVWDASSPDGDEIVSRLTVLMYLNDDFVGGETNFFRPVSAPKPPTKNNDNEPGLIASVRPVAGSCLLFPQGVGEEAVEYARQNWPLHEGSPVYSGRSKYVIRSDALFVTQKEPLPVDDELFCHDHIVRDAFLPRSAAVNDKFLGHLSSLYNPHMGVENLGPFLYSFIRFTKKKRILEIGAGYTTVWILQALKENDEEIRRARSIQRDNTCRLLNIDWTIPDIVEDYDKEAARLLCVDNCAHQKETATGASAVAKTLGLEEYLEFRKGDAFELDLETNSVDILWCDFGVGSRMREYVSSAWDCLRPGGFLICHSTLTNRNTREWLEAARSRGDEKITGIPPDEYVELSLLEPHKRFQNSISLFQKRKTSSGEVYEEPIYSTYA